MKKITNARALSRLFSRFKLQESEPEDFNLIEKVSPVTNIDELLRVTNLPAAILTSVTAVGVYYPFAVPAGKRWRLRGFQATKSTGTWTIDAILLDDGTGAVNLNAKLYSTAVTNAQTLFDGQEIILEPGWKVGVNVDTYSVTGNMQSKILYEEEDAY